MVLGTVEVIRNFFPLFGSKMLFAWLVKIGRKENYYTRCKLECLWGPGR